MQQQRHRHTYHLASVYQSSMHHQCTYRLNVDEIGLVPNAVTQALPIATPLITALELIAARRQVPLFLHSFNDFYLYIDIYSLLCHCSMMDKYAVLDIDCIFLDNQLCILNNSDPLNCLLLPMFLVFQFIFVVENINF